MPRYIHQLPDWPQFRWDECSLSGPLTETRLRQGRLLGRMESLGLAQQDETVLQSLTEETVKSSEIEGETLPSEQVRSSVARRLGLDAEGLPPADRRVDGVVAMTLDAARDWEKPLTEERLLAWQKGLFSAPPAGVRVGAWRAGPVQVVSGAYGRERVHFEGPPAERVPAEMSSFVAWVNGEEGHPLARAALAHLRIVTVHPFDDGNGRVARAAAAWALARSERGARRFYSMSAQIRLERKAYYDVLERAQKGTLDVTEWLDWFLACLGRAFGRAEETLASALAKDRFWRRHAGLAVNERQRLVLNRLLDGGFVGKLTTTKWGKLAGCSHDTAQRDIEALIAEGILVKGPAGGRSTSYALKAAS